MSITGLLDNKHPDATELIIELLNDRNRNLKQHESDNICRLANKQILSVAKKNKKFKYDWIALSRNLYALDILISNPHKINWDNFTEMPSSDKYLKYIEKNLNNIDKKYIGKLSKRNDMMHILEKNPHIIDWEILSENENAIDLLEKKSR